MPFVSDKQRAYLWANKPEVAKKFAEHSNKNVESYADRAMRSKPKKKLKK